MTTIPYVDNTIEIVKKIRKEAEDKAIAEEKMKDAAQDMLDALTEIRNDPDNILTDETKELIARVISKATK